MNQINNYNNNKKIPINHPNYILKSNSNKISKEITNTNNKNNNNLYLKMSTIKISTTIVSTKKAISTITILRIIKSTVLVKLIQNKNNMILKPKITLLIIPPQTKPIVP